MEIITDYKNKAEWNKFVADNTSPSSFLQSWEWGEFNEKILGNKVVRLSMLVDNKLVMTASLIRKELPSGHFYYYCPRGIVWAKDFMDKRADYYRPILKKAEAELGEAVFLRLDLPYEHKDYLAGFLGRLGFRKPKILTKTSEPKSTLLLDITRSEEDLLEKMNQKTRYNIRLAEKKGIQIRIMNYESRIMDKDIEKFYQLSKEMAGRNKIKIYERSYYEKLVNFFGQGDKDVKLKLYLAEYEGRALGSIMVVYFGNGATYLHGASSNEHRELMPNYLLQWKAIMEAKKEGYKIYDFWGVSEENRHWAGITRFKHGFGGKTVEYLGSWDYVLNKKWYNLLWGAKFFKKIIP